MSAFNELNLSVECPTCKKTTQFCIQFKFGNVWQFKYELNDKLKWGGNDVGEQGLAKVMVDGCGLCLECDQELDFDIKVIEDKIESATPSKGEFSYEKASYVVLTH